VQNGYRGPLFAEILPRSFSIRVKKGSRLNQIRFRKLNSSQIELPPRNITDKELRRRHAAERLVDGDPDFRGGLVLRVDLRGEEKGSPIGYRAQRFTDIIDVDQAAQYDPADYWDAVYARDRKRIILDPHQFYILSSRERIHIPPDLAAEMVPIDPAMGEFRVHYAGFFDPGFGYTPEGRPGSKAVLEVRSHEVPFLLEDGQIIGRLEYEKLADMPDVLYGQGGTSNYQGQGLKLSKHFRA
jgi:dCTP deaminase